MLDGTEIDGVKVIVRPVKDHRLIVVFRGDGLNAELSESDPQQTGMAPIKVKALNPDASHTASIVNKFIKPGRRYTGWAPPG